MQTIYRDIMITRSKIKMSKNANGEELREALHLVHKPMEDLLIGKVKKKLGIEWMEKHEKSKMDSWRSNSSIRPLFSIGVWPNSFEEPFNNRIIGVTQWIATSQWEGRKI